MTGIKPTDNEEREIGRLLASTPLFAELDETQLHRATATLRAAHLHKGERLFAQGDPAERFYLLVRGQMKLYRLSPDGQEKVIELIQPGQTFAEALMFTPGPGTYPVYAEAIEPSLAVGFDNVAFKDLLRDSVDTCFRLMASMSVRLHRQINEIDRLTLQNATTRLAAFLVEQGGETGEATRVKLTTPKNLIASRLSIAPETLSRILGRLARDGYIEVDGSDIVLLRPAALRALVRQGSG